MGEAAKSRFGDDGDDRVIRLPAKTAAGAAARKPDESDAPSAKAAANKATGTALIPYQDPEMHMFRDLRERGYRAPTRVFWPLKLLRTALLLIAFIAFAGGLYDNVSWTAHKLVGTPLTGTVTALEPAAAGLSTPVVDYTLPFDRSEWRVSSRLPRGDLAVGDSISLSVIPGSEGLTRIERSGFWNTLSMVALIGGGVSIWAILTLWSGVEATLGWRRQRESATSSTLRYAAAGTIALVLSLTFWMRAIYMPWLGVSEYGSLLFSPDEVMRKAALRCGPSATGPLNACELTAMGVRSSAAPGAYVLALQEADYVSLARYNAAVANPDIDFAIDWRRSAPLLLERDPAVLVGLLVAGSVPPREVANELLAGAEARGWTEAAAGLREVARRGG